MLKKKKELYSGKKHYVECIILDQRKGLDQGNWM